MINCSMYLVFANFAFLALPFKIFVLPFWSIFSMFNTSSAKISTRYRHENNPVLTVVDIPTFWR